MLSGEVDIEMTKKARRARLEWKLGEPLTSTGALDRGLAEAEPSLSSPAAKGQRPAQAREACRDLRRLRLLTAALIFIP
jgi:hypothetical protein